MKIIIFEKRPYETKIIEEYKNKYNLEIITTDEILDKNTISLCENADAISILGYSNIDKEIIDKIKKYNIKHISTRTIGYNHINVQYAKEKGITVSNVTYSPNGVADFTLMLMLIAIRKYKPAMWRQNVNDYTLNGLMGKEMQNQTVGVIGTGRIGAKVISDLSGFGCKIIAYDKYFNPDLKNKVKYVSLDEIYKNSDIITIHIPLLKENIGMINQNAISKMKNGVILVNTARSELMEIKALTEGIENEKIGALALDVFENEDEIYHHNRSCDIIKNKDMAYLRQFPNVILTQHMAFFTDSAVEEMITNSLNNIIEFNKTSACKNML